MTAGKTGPQLDPRDVAVVRSHALVNLGRRAELFGGLDVLLRQPDSMHEPRWQSVLAGVRARATSQVAGYVRGQLGASLAGAGRWGQVEIAGQLQREVLRRPRVALSWKTAVGACYTRSPTTTDRTANLGEILAATGFVFRERNTGRWELGGWWSLDLGVGADGDDARWGFGMSQGLLLGLGRGFDVFVEQVIMGRARTTLPNLADGFPHVRWRIGFNRRFGARRIARVSR
jgi:hypothetical protein